MTLRHEIKEVILGAARRIIENQAGDLSTSEKLSLRADFEANIASYSGRYPILGLLNRIEGVADAGHVAAVTANATTKGQRGELSLGWDDSRGSFRAPIASRWSLAIKESAAEVTHEYFRKASACFDDGRREQATEYLCSAIICSVASIAALMGWPHSDHDDDLRAVVGLATGSLPDEGESIYKLLQSASQQGQDLNSAFAAAMGQPADVRSGAYDEAGRTPEEAILFAETVVNLADQLGRNLR